MWVSLAGENFRNFRVSAVFFDEDQREIGSRYCDILGRPI